MRYETVIFDLDGTLLDTLDDLVTSVNEYLAESGHPLRTREEIRAFLGYGARELVRDALPEPLSGEALDTAVDEYKQVYRRNMTDSTKPYDGILEMLKALKDASVRTAVVSNKPDNSVVDLCRTMFGDLVSIAAGDQPGFARKPHPQLVEHVMHELSADPATTLYVGDSEVDVETAKNAGIDGAAVTWGFRDRDVLEAEKPVYIVSSPVELEKIVGVCAQDAEKGQG